MKEDDNQKTTKQKGSGFTSSHDPDNQKIGRRGTTKGVRVEGTKGDGWGETGGERGLVAGHRPGWRGANRPPGTRRCRTIWRAVKERGAAGAPG